MLCRSAILIALLAFPALSGEIAVLTTGYKIPAASFELHGETVRLHTAGGVIEVPLAAIARIEPDDAPPLAAAEQSSAVPETLTEVAAVMRPAREIVTEAALRHGLPPEFVHSVAAVESAYNVQAISPKGAIGIMQLMPGTAKELSADPHHPEENVDAGVRYLRGLLLKYKDHPDQVRLALAAYNAGPGAVDRYNGIPPYRETIEYLRKVLDRYQKLKK